METGYPIPFGLWVSIIYSRNFYYEGESDSYILEKKDHNFQRFHAHSGLWGASWDGSSPALPILILKERTKVCLKEAYFHLKAQRVVFTKSLIYCPSFVPCGDKERVWFAHPPGSTQTHQVPLVPTH